jgi:endonuclease-8
VPEGHTLHRYSGMLRPDLAGEVVSASSPQGRFAAEAARVDGGRLAAVEAYGKNLFLDVHPRPDGAGLDGPGSTARGR